MTRVLAPLVLVTALCGCAARLDPPPAPQFATTGYPGSVVGDISTLNRHIAACAAERAIAAKRYNDRSRWTWLWDFGTAALGLVGSAAAGLLERNDDSEDAADVAQISTIVVTLSLGLKAASQVEERLNERKAEYDEWQSHIGYVNTAFPAVDQGLRANRTAAREQFRLVLERVRSACPAGSP